MLVWEKIDSYAPEKGSFEAWLSALTRNTALNRRRGLLRRETGRIEENENRADEAPGPEELLLKQERAMRVREVLRRMDAQEKNLFYRKYYYMQSTAQIAAEMGLTQRAVEGRLRRLRLRLRKELGGERYA
jgi:RNA polymerase sigma-70 factor (ECF subfamily)